mmetsp:Transcript_4861/g.20005  ORF Transcript_4861/g.20005 Transcript_4861/m.20005 type:complete len:216 (+) Transcript_4861:1073-1720(+)
MSQDSSMNMLAPSHLRSKTDSGRLLSRALFERSISSIDCSSPNSLGMSRISLSARLRNSSDARFPSSFGRNVSLLPCRLRALRVSVIRPMEPGTVIILFQLASSSSSWVKFPISAGNVFNSFSEINNVLSDASCPIAFGRVFRLLPVSTSLLKETHAPISFGMLVISLLMRSRVSIAVNAPITLGTAPVTSPFSRSSSMTRPSSNDTPTHWLSSC